MHGQKNIKLLPRCYQIKFGKFQLFAVGHTAVLNSEFQIFRKYTRYYRGADKSLARPTSRCILFDGENISFDASLVIYI